jgi:hypothetical protein
MVEEVVRVKSLSPPRAAMVTPKVPISMILPKRYLETISQFYSIVPIDLCNYTKRKGITFALSSPAFKKVIYRVNGSTWK